MGAGRQKVRNSKHNKGEQHENVSNEKREEEVRGGRTKLERTRRPEEKGQH